MELFAETENDLLDDSPYISDESVVSVSDDVNSIDDLSNLFSGDDTSLTSSPESDTIEIVSFDDDQAAVTDNTLTQWPDLTESSGENVTKSLDMSDPSESVKESDATEVLDNIYNLLDERLPDKQSETSVDTEEAVTESISETEISLSDINEGIKSLYILESEQFIEFQTLHDDFIKHSNNDYYFSFFAIGGIFLILGSLMIFFLLRRLP